MTLAAAGGIAGGAEPPWQGRPLGLVVHSLWNRWQGRYSSVKMPPLTTAPELLDHCLELGCGGLQTTVAGWTAETAREVRGVIEAHGLYLEGSIEPPRDRADTARFERELRRAKDAGATLLRAYLGGRRYEEHRSAESFKRYRERAWERLTLAEPLLRRHGLRLGVENHKDFRAAELAELLAKLGSAHVGCCFDFGNNLALLETPEESLDALGPYLVTTHLKDMAVQPDAAGFLLAEVPLGQGILDLPALMARCLSANPRVTFNLEMITRDSLLVPCLEETYWAAMSGVGGDALAALLRLARDRRAEKLGRIGGKSPEAICLWEAEQNAACARHAFEALGLTRHGQR